MKIRYFLSTALVSLCLAAPLAAADRLYVVCDNGLRCFKAPCPSSTVHDLATGKTFKSISPVLDRLAAADRERISQTNALYFGRLALRGHVERGEEASVLVVTGVAREASAGERRGCPTG